MIPNSKDNMLGVLFFEFFGSISKDFSTQKGAIRPQTNMIFGFSVKNYLYLNTSPTVSATFAFRSMFTPIPLRDQTWNRTGRPVPDRPVRSGPVRSGLTFQTGRSSPVFTGLF